MAIAIKQQVDPSYLLQSSQWRPQGWSIVRRGVIRPVLVDASTRAPINPVGIDAFEWTDVNGFGIGNTDDALSRLKRELANRGGTLYAYALLRRDVVNFLGIHAWSYRLVLLHNPAVIVPILEWAVLIMAIAFAAIIFIQYLTTGRSPALQDLSGMWNTGVMSVGAAAGQAGAAVVSPFIWASVAAGTIAIAFALAGKSAGVKTRAPAPTKGSVGVKVRGVSGRVGN